MDEKQNIIRMDKRHRKAKVISSKHSVHANLKFNTGMPFEVDGLQKLSYCEHLFCNLFVFTDLTNNLEILDPCGSLSTFIASVYIAGI